MGLVLLADQPNVFQLQGFSMRSKIGVEIFCPRESSCVEKYKKSLKNADRVCNSIGIQRVQLVGKVI